MGVMSDALLRTLLSVRRPPLADLPTLRSALAAWPSPIDRALVGGALADGLGLAFAAGYDAALHALFADLPLEEHASLCVTEAGGAHPRAIATTLREGRLTGEKVFATLAGDADWLYVAASTGWEGEQHRLVVARVRAERARLTPLPATPFAPEIGHFAVRFDDVEVDAVLPGDGWTDWVRPFRTVEDTHVAAAATAHLLAIARGSGWPEPLVERLLALAMALRAVAGLPADDPATHLALAGCFAALRALLDVAEPCWPSAPPDVAARWRRDAPILRVAEKAREARRTAAWRAIGG